MSIRSEKGEGGGQGEKGGGGRGKRGRTCLGVQVFGVRGKVKKYAFYVK